VREAEGERERQCLGDEAAARSGRDLRTGGARALRTRRLPAPRTAHLAVLTPRPRSGKSGSARVTARAQSCRSFIARAVREP
jgi:hypothetical protein